MGGLENSGIPERAKLRDFNGMDSALIDSQKAMELQSVRKRNREMKLPNVIQSLFEDVILELQKSGNEDATNLIDRIDRVLNPLHQFNTTSQIPGDIQVSDFVPEFIEKLIDQLKLDHNRWGSTWLNRPKEGQELRTKARFEDYFAQFLHASVDVPWMKIVGGALICWIREQHPELCQDANACICPDVDVTIKTLGHDGPCVASEIPVPAEQVEEKCGLLVKSLQDVEQEHEVGCSSYNNPSKGFASSVSDCDCAFKDISVEEATTKELIESKRSISELTKIPLGDLTEEEAQRLKNWISRGKPCSIAHVCNETITDFNRGTFAYTGRIILDSIKFVCHSKNHPDFVLATCNEKGILVPNSRQVGIIGVVSPSGQYQFKAMSGVGAQDTLLVSYDYEYDLPGGAE